MTLVARARTLMSRSETARVSTASLTMVAVRMLGTAATFLYTILIARTMTPGDVGLVWTIWSATFVAGTLATLNIGAGAVREIVKARAENRDDVAAGFVVASRRTLLFATPPVVAGFLLIAWWRAPETLASHWGAYLFACLSIPMLGWVQTNGSQATALHQMLKSQVPRELVRPAVFLVAFAVIWLAGWQPTAGFAVALYLVAVVLSAILQFQLLRPAFAFMRDVRPDTGEWRDWAVSGLSLAPMLLLAEYLRNIIILFASLAVDAAAVGQIAIALSVVNFPNFGIVAVEIAFSAKLSQALLRGDRERVLHFLAVSNALKAAGAIPACLILAVFAEPILRIFGEHYADGAAVSAWLTLIPLSRAVFGNSTLVMQVKGLRGEIFWSSLATVALMGLGIVAGGRAGGPEAAAAAAALVFATLQLVRCLWCLRVTGIDTSLLGTFRYGLARMRARAKR